MKDFVQMKVGSIPIAFFSNISDFKSSELKKLFLIMKLSLVILILLTMQVRAVTYAQSVTLDTKNATLKSVFKELRTQTGYDFIYNNEVLAKAQLVNLQVKDKETKEVLDLLFQGQPLTYTIEDKTIVVKVKIERQRPITGIVRDKVSGAILPGVSVRLKGTNISTTTDGSGRYRISVEGTSGALLFSYVGYSTLEVPVGNNDQLNVELQSADTELSEVVVQAYGSTTKRQLANAVSTITSKEIEQRSITNINTALVGAAPGIQTTTGSGQPGSGPAIRIRGFNSINGGLDPLYIVDGAPYPENLINNINPDDIESISVLKDAAASALYGARAAAGVVIISTKTGKPDSKQLSVKLNHGINSRGLSDYEKVDAFDYYELMWETYRNNRLDNGDNLAIANQLASDNIIGALVYNPFTVQDNQIVSTDGTINPAAELMYPRDLDWQRALRKAGQRMDYNLSHSGGGNSTDHFASFGYLKDEGYSILTDFERFNGRVNVNTKVNKWLKAGLNASGGLQKTRIGNESSGIWENPFYTDLIFGPIYPVHQHNNTTGAYLLDGLGQRIYDPGDTRPIAPGRNVIAETEYNDNYTQRNLLSGRTYLEISPLKGLKFTTNLSLDYNNYMSNVFDNPIIGDGVSGAGRSYRTRTNTRTVNFNQLLNYNRAFGGHNLDLLAGHEAYQYQYNYMYGAAEGQIVAGSTELANFANILSLNSYQDNYRVESYFGRVQYDYKGKYLATASWRTDGSSRFGRNNKWGTYWSASAGWIINEEDFFEADWVDLLKLRASYGQVGSDVLGSYYLSQTLYQTTNSQNGNEAGVRQSVNLGNEDIQWESNNSMDVALEFGLFNNRLSGTVEYFNKYTDNLLFEVPLATSQGLNYQYQNFGSLVNEGVEIHLEGDVIRKQDFRWRLGTNWTRFKNEIRELPFEEYIDGTKKYMVGKSRYDYWLRQWYGVDPNTGVELYYAENPNAANTFQNENGDYVTSDFNNALFDYSGSSIPKFMGALDNTLSYKSFTLDFRFIYQWGGTSRDADYMGLMHDGTYGRALHQDAQNRWQQPGDITDVPRRTTGNVQRSSTRWLIDASYLYLRTATLTYNLPGKWTARYGINNSRVYLSGENLFLWSRRKGFDPSQAFNGNTSYTYAPTRIVSIGLNVGF